MMNIKSKKRWQEKFLDACVEGDLKNIRYLCQKQYLDKGWADIHFHQEYAFRLACIYGHLDVVKYWLTSTDLKDAGHTWADVHAQEDDGFSLACEHEHWDVIGWLVIDYEINKTPAIKKIIEKYPQAKEYFRAREELKEIKALIKKTSKSAYHQDNERKEDRRAAKKAKKL